MKSKKKTSILRFVYIGATILVIVLIGIFTVDVEEMEAAFTVLNLRWMFACVGCLFLYWLTDAVLLNDITSYMYKRESFWHSLKVGIVGLYYGALTPFATGGQPMQVVYMRRNRMPVGTATCIVGVKFVVYELSLCALFITAMVLYGPELYAQPGAMFWFAILGFVVNASAVFFIIMTLVNKTLVSRIGNALIRFFSKIKIIRKPEKAQHNFEHTINDYHSAAEYIAHHKLRAIGSFFISVVNLLFFFAVPYFIYMAFGAPGGKAVQDIIALQAFLYIAISFVPTPGSAVAAEGGFHAIFSAIFGAGAVFAPMLIWRFLTYYLMLIVGSIVVVFDEVFAIRRAGKDVEEETESE
ncbi:MAG: flippase-like domain-containing protein [Clostridia bacterium]|jgi:glycosyltransferase 2 family protein|nr:flippase-like domain-containing protein [Clostridia bacterium]MBT7123010.1 flippase-like domain-containing protein [Clostridia bacterium]